MKCPKCGLINDEGVQRCDCGYNFATGVKDQAFVRRQRRWRTWSRNQVLAGIAIAVLIEIVAIAAFGQLLAPGGLFLLIPIGYGLTWVDIKP